MSQRMKRIEKKVAKITDNFEKEKYLNLIVEEANLELKRLLQVLEEANQELDDIWQEYTREMAYIYKDNYANVSYDVATLYDGTKLDVTIIEHEDVILVSSLGLVGKAKKHPDDKYDFNTGYYIALHRLMGKILSKLYGYEGA